MLIALTELNQDHKLLHSQNLAVNTFRASSTQMDKRQMFEKKGPNLLQSWKVS